MIEVDSITYILIQFLGFLFLSKLGRMLGKQIRRALNEQKEKR